MPRWQDVMLAIAQNADEHYDALKRRLGERLGLERKLQIIAFRSYGTHERLLVKGRVIVDRGVRSARDNDDTWDNLLNMYRRFQSHEAPYARVLARYGAIEQELVANEEGFFEAWLPAAEPGRPVAAPVTGPEFGISPPPPGAPVLPHDPTVDGDSPWREVELELLEPEPADGEPVRATCYVLAPPPTARLGVISDIDDTVVRTDVGHFVQMARTIFLGYARMRLPFEGVAAFYRALYTGASGHDRNPLFYVSNSPWNMYDIFSDFFQMQDIPIGPVLILRDWGVSRRNPDQAPLHAREYKTAAVRAIMDTYPHLPFILLGDSGEKDPEVYDEVVAHAPDRVPAVYIRNVSHRPERVEAIQKLAEQVVAAGSTLILADNTLPLAQHAAAQGWIDPAALPRIAEAKAADEAPPTPLEQLLGEPQKAPGPTVVVEGQAPSTDEVKDALKTGDEQGQAPPTVVVKGNEGNEGTEVNRGNAGNGETAVE